MYIPKFIKDQLDEVEIRMAEDFVKERKLVWETEETCTPTQPWHYEVHSCGIGDEIHIVYGKERLALLSEETINNL